MADIDTFAAGLLEESKRFLEKSKDAPDDVSREAFLHASLLLAFCSLEAHVNAVSDDFAERPELSVHTKGVLLEKEVRLSDGEFILGGLRMSKLEDRILVLFRHFSGEPLDKQVAWWGQLKQAILTRNKLTHPKAAQPITLDDVKTALAAIVSSLDALYRVIYKKPFPAANMGLDSKLNF